MRHARNVVPALVLFVTSSAMLASDVQKFDGKWLTTVSCANYRDALGFSYQFVSTVKDGAFHGVHGTEGEPGSLVIDGKIPDDGKASLYAKGRTGSKEYVPGRDTPRGTEYGYNIDASSMVLQGQGRVSRAVRARSSFRSSKKWSSVVGTQIFDDCGTRAYVVQREK